jgi:hypothetical protein
MGSFCRWWFNGCDWFNGCSGCDWCARCNWSNWSNRFDGCDWFNGCDWCDWCYWRDWCSRTACRFLGYVVEYDNVQRWRFG